MDSFDELEPSGSKNERPSRDGDDCTTGVASD